VSAGQPRDFNAEERQRWGGPSPHAGKGERPLTAQERIEARHLLQELSEQAKGVRDAMDPVHGMHTIRLDTWRAQYDSLIAQLRYFTERLTP
jgi:hypothetical protein